MKKITKQIHCLPLVLLSVGSLRSLEPFSWMIISGKKLAIQIDTTVNRNEVWEKIVNL